MHARSGTSRSQSGGGLLFAVVAALLIAPTVFVVALFTLAGPSTRAAMAGDDADDVGEPAALFSASGRARPDDSVLRPLSDTSAEDTANVAPIFEPRVGRFGLSDADPGADDDHADHEHRDGQDAQAVESRSAASVGAGLGVPARRFQVAPTPAPTPWPAGPPRATAELPILMYHYTGPLPPNPDVFRRDLTVSPALFEGQLAALAETGVETVTLDRLFEHLEGRQPLPPKAVALTFDDGYLDNYEVAFPLLRQYEMVGTFFITTGLVGRPGYMTWEHLEEMAAAGMAIEAHSITHADLTRIAPAQLSRELALPRQEIEARLGRPARFVAYPGGRFDPTVIRATKAAGYTAAVTTQHGHRHTGAGPFELTRVRVRGTETVQQLVAKLTPPSWRTLARQP